MDAKGKHRYRTFPSLCAILLDSLSLDHCIKSSRTYRRAICGSFWGSVFISWQLCCCYPLSSYGIPCTDMDILTTWLEVEAAYPAVCFWSSAGWMGWVPCAGLLCWECSRSVPQKRAAWHGREAVALDSALAPSYSSNMTMGKLHLLSEFLCPCLLTIACKILELLHVKHI